MQEKVLVACLSHFLSSNVRIDIFLFQDQSLVVINIEHFKQQS